MNLKRTYRLYREEGLVGRRRKRKRVAVARTPTARPRRLNECWGIDFMSDALANGRRFRILNVVDTFSHEALACEADTSLPASRVIQTLEEIALERGAYPARLSLDNGPEFRSQTLDAWAYARGVALDFIQPGKPVQNADIESFNGKMRDELLNVHWWHTIQEAQDAILWHKQDYNRVRPHSSLGNRTPSEFARVYAEALNTQGLVS